MKKDLISNLKNELDVLSNKEKSNIEGSQCASDGWVYGDGCCRLWPGYPPYNCGYPAGYSGPC